MAQHTIDLPCVLDTYVDWKNPTTSFGAASTLLTGALTFDGYGAYNKKYYHIRYITMLKFDFSSLPTGKTITDAKLRVYSINHVDNNNSSDTYPYNPFVVKPLWYEFSESDNYNTLISQWVDYEGFRSIINPSESAYIDIDFIAFINNTDVKSKGIAISWEGAGETGYGAEGPVWQIGARNSTNPPMVRVIYEDTVPEKPTVIDPIGSCIDNSNIIRFRWQYNNTFGLQKKFDFKWSADGNSWTTVSQVTTNNYYDMPANTLPAGNIYWKVITYNEYDEASPESVAAVFYATGIPSIPTTTVSVISAKPTIAWLSASQQIAEIQVLKDGDIIYESGSIPDMSIRTHKVNKFLTDGAYTARVRIKNEFDLLSGWGAANFVLSIEKPTKPSLALSQSKYSITAISTGTNDGYLLLYRADVGSSNFKCVAKSATNIIFDYTVENNKQYQYFVRAVSNNETFADSDIKCINSPDIMKSVLAPVSDLSNIFEVKCNLSESIKRNIAIGTPNTTNYFCGRKYPVAEYSEHFSGGISLLLFIIEDEEYRKLLEIVYRKETVLYRDDRRILYGNITGLNVTDHFMGYIISITINQTDYSGDLEV